jgi:hypothetical protein
MDISPTWLERYFAPISLASDASRSTSELGRFDVIVNDAAISRSGKPGTSFEKMPPERPRVDADPRRVLHGGV